MNKIITTTKKITLFLISAFFFFFANQVQADWQGDLEAQFDIVSTFDELQDWHGTRAGGDVTYETNHPEDLPQLKTGGKGIWGMYSQYYDGPSQVKEEWIGNHHGEVWSGTKSAAINYGSLYCASEDHDAEKGYGPGRLGMYIGDGTPTSGYRKIHVFFMMKFPMGYWTLKDQSEWADQNIREYKYPPIVKMFDCVTGFDSVENYHEHSCQPNISHEYGTNFSIFNTGGGGASRGPYLYFTDGGGVTKYDTDEECWRYAYKDSNQHMYPETNFQSSYEKNEWFGVEYALDLGTIGNSDGSTEFWVYDKEGNQIGHYFIDNINMQQHFTYNYNKLVWGGNYQCAGGADTPGITHWYLDDVIINNQRIGPTYFNMLNNQNQTIRADVDNNSTINTTDAMLTLRNSLGLSMSGTNWYSSTTTGDVNCDGTSNSTDAMLILRYSLGLSMEGTGWCE